MAGLPAKRTTERFSPEVRGWAALHLVPLVWPGVREGIEVHRPPGGGAATFFSDALSLVSRAAHVEWARAVAAEAPALGVAAGPACLLRLWVARLLRPGGGLAAYWSSVVADVWRVAAPALAITGLPVRGAGREDLKHEVAPPLALTVLRSLAAGRRDLRLLDGEAGPLDGPPFGWAPGIDAWPATLRYLLLGQVPGRFRSHAFLSSPVARLLRQSGLAVPMAVTEWVCPLCGVRVRCLAGPRCRQCGGLLAGRRATRLVARTRLEWADAGRGDEAAPWGDRAESPANILSVPDRVEALAVRRECMRRARHLWEQVVLGGRHGRVAVLVLAALAGVRPLESVLNRPPRPEWLERLVEVLVEGRLDRRPIAERVNRALAPSCREPDGAGRRVQASHVGVLANRFRRAVIARRADG